MNWNVLLVHIIFHVIYFKRDRLKRNFGQPRHYTIFLLKFRCSTTISQFKIPGFFHCAILSMSSSDVMLSVCLLSWTHTLMKCKPVALSEIMPLNSGIPDVHQGLYSLLGTWSVRLHRGTMWFASFLSVGCSILDDEALCSGLSGWELVLNSTRECWKKLLVHSNHLQES